MESGEKEMHPSRPPVVCCNMYGTHAKEITKDLRAMTEKEKDSFLLQAPHPLYWCSSCRKRSKNPVTAVLDPMSTDTKLPVAADTQNNLKHNLDLPAGDKTPSAKTLTGTEHLDLNPEYHSVPCVGDGNEMPLDETLTVNVDSGPEPQRPSGSLHCGFLGTPTPCSGALRETQSLVYDERRALEYLAKLSRITSEVTAVCDSHYQALIGVHKEMAPTFTKSCCNPFKDHFRRISTSLRPIKMIILLKAQKKNISLVYGDMICTNCVKRLFDVDATQKVESPENNEVNVCLQPIQCSQESGSSTSTNVSPAITKAKAIASLTALGVSNFKPQKRTYQGLIKYANEKVDEAAELSKKKICLALDLPATSLESSAPQRAIDMDLLLEDIRKELPKADKARTYQLLSLVPLSINTNQACGMFNISKSLFNKARELRVQQGILPVVKFSRHSSVSDATRKSIIDFYCDDDNSKLMPGINDKVSMSKGVYEQKRLLLCSVEELYSVFKKKYPELKVGLSVFYKLRPKYCVGAGATGTHKICVCQTHEDVRLLVNALGINTYYRDLISHVVCNEESQTCMLRLCENCLNTAQIECFLRGEIIKAANASSPEEEDVEEFWGESIQYLQWTTSNKQTELVNQLSKRSHVVRLAAEKLEQMIPHEFIARKQSAYVKELKSSLPPNKVVVLMDFAMNFSCIFPSEIQSYHFSKKQVTIHPTVIFHRREGQEETDYHNICFISPDLTHDVSMVQVFTRRIVEIIKEKFPEVAEVEYLTDGCASQYKNKISFWNLCHHRTLYQMKATHTYFASSHGKNLCDALAGIIKRALATGSLQCKQENIINSAEKAYEFCRKHSLSDKVNFVFVPKEEVEHERTVTVDGNLLNCVPGTRSFHFYEPQSENTIGCKRISEMSTYQLIHCLEKEQIDDTPQRFETGCFIVVKVNSRKYLGLLTDIDTVEQEAEVSLLRPPLPSEVFHWPKNLASMVVPLPHVMCMVELHELPDNRYSLTEADRHTLINKKIIRQKNP